MTQEVYWHDWKSWPQKYRRVYIAVWPVSAIALMIVTLLFAYAVVLLLAVGFCISPLFWLYEKISDIASDLAYEWRRP